MQTKKYFEKIKNSLILKKILKMIESVQNF